MWHKVSIIIFLFLFVEYVFFEKYSYLYSFVRKIIFYTLCCNFTLANIFQNSFAQIFSWSHGPMQSNIKISANGKHWISWCVQEEEEEKFQGWLSNFIFSSNYNDQICFFSEIILNKKIKLQHLLNEFFSVWSVWENFFLTPMRNVMKTLTSWVHFSFLFLIYTNISIVFYVNLI